MSSLRFVSWNVNGIRAIIKKDFIQDIKALNPDFLCLQEIKAQPEEARTALSILDGYQVFTNSSKEKKGYSGTAILSSKTPLQVTYDLGLPEHDQEGRVITAEFDAFFLVTVYTPNSGEDLKRLDYRAEWDTLFRDHITALQAKKPVILCGDLNVAHQDIDIARGKANYNKTSGYTQTEIDGISSLLGTGMIDTYRYLHPEEVKYSWWNYKFLARERNVGWRIDYFLISDSLKANIAGAEIHNEYFGSDHCPVSLDLTGLG